MRRSKAQDQGNQGQDEEICACRSHRDEDCEGSEKHIAPLVLGGIIAAGASLAGNAIGSASQSKVNDTNLQISRENNEFNAAEAEKQRNWQESMWDKNNEYNSPSAMISRGLNPYIGSSAGAGVSKSPASGGAAASAATSPSLYAQIQCPLQKFPRKFSNHKGLILLYYL